MSKAPPLSLGLREIPHVLHLWTSPFRKARKPVGGAAQIAGQPLIVVPGLVSGDRTTSLMRRSFDAAGFRTYGSTFRLLTGVTPERMARSEARLAEVVEQEGRKTVLVGWSLGGLISRVLAQRHPDKVAMVVTLGTPFSGDRRANNAWRLYHLLNDHTVDAPSVSDDISVKPPVHTVAIWSPIDGVIAPECARGQDGERDVAVEMRARHLAFGAQPKAIEQIVAIVSEQLANID
ncbi:alpha/beta fold hydrolase [uncultured Erythrobacter sp.]|uniref:esterase/lipase family protein n=1 Tax=uncultured Erythrobacter sp. TaxID=263913 RepID=UPI002606ECE4|nr:alpha/beta fold hydrolase [uncultured Erythrobacter sp.]